uniref:WD repeat domain 74 n=1 Tax=Oncorhynchus mykiss TaxID=8022 RepID=A0A8K9XL32_ONCMY
MYTIRIFKWLSFTLCVCFIRCEPIKKKQAFNFCEMNCLSRDQEVCVLGWGDPQETVGSVNGTVKRFSTEKGFITETRQCGESNQGRFTGLAATDRYSCVDKDTGLLRVWKEDNTDKVGINIVKNVCRIPETPVFASKNVRNDWLDLRVPEWVRDMAFIADSDKIDTCTGQHQVCLSVFHCTSPVLRLEAVWGVPPPPPPPVLSLPANQDSVTVGNTHGQLAILGLRKGECVCGCLKGLAGGVWGLQVHSLEDRSLWNKVYLKSRLNCVLLSSRDLELGSTGVNGDSGELDEVWNTMGMIKEKAKKRETDEAVVEEAEKMKMLLKKQTRRLRRGIKHCIYF